MFISFEGIDGSGKSTLMAGIVHALEQHGTPYVLTREPGATVLGKEIRQLLLHTECAISAEAELLLYAADRAQHVQELIQPCLRKGHWVLSDRFVDSTTAYQGYGRQLDLSLVQKLNDIATAGLLPHNTIVLDGPVDVLLGRAKKRSQETQEAVDRLEAESVTFFERIRQGYLALAKAEPERFVVLDATQLPEAILQQALTALGLLV